MAAPVFPTSPTNGQEYTINGMTWVWDNAAGRWDVSIADPLESTHQPADIAVSCTWTGSTWVTNSGGVVPTDTSLIRVFYSQDDPAATAPPGPYNANDLWFGASS